MTAHGRLTGHLKQVIAARSRLVYVSGAATDYDHTVLKTMLISVPGASWIRIVVTHACLYIQQLAETLFALLPGGMGQTNAQHLKTSTASRGCYNRHRPG
jgi:hypothetical protein